MRLIYAIELNFRAILAEMKRVCKKSNVLEMFVDRVVEQIPYNFTNIVELKDRLYLTASEGEVYVLVLNIATGEVVKSYPGGIKLVEGDDSEVCIEAETPTEKDPSVYITLKDMQIHTTLVPSLCFVNFGGLDLSVTNNGQIVHRHKQELSMPLCHGSQWTNNIHFARCYDGKNVIFGNYEKWSRGEPKKAKFF